MKLSLLFYIFTHISLNIDPRILNPHTPEYLFPSAGHMYFPPLTLYLNPNSIEELCKRN